MTRDPEQRDQSVEGGALDPEGEGERLPGETQEDPVESGALEDDEQARAEGDDPVVSPNRGRLPDTGSETGRMSGAQVTDFRPGNAEPTPLAGADEDDE